MTPTDRLAEIRARHQKATSIDLPPIHTVWSSSLEFLSDLAWLVDRVVRLEQVAEAARQRLDHWTPETYRALTEALAALDPEATTEGD